MAIFHKRQSMGQSGMRRNAPAILPTPPRFGGPTVRPLLAACLLLTAAGCRDSRQTERSAAPPLILASVLPQAYFVREIAGADVQVEVIIPPGSSAETYEPGIKEMRLASRADAYLCVGHPKFPFEQAWLDKLKAANPGLKVFNTSRGVDLIEDDPHTWLSLHAAPRILQNVGEALVAVLPDKASLFADNLANLTQRVENTSRSAIELLKPYRGRKFFTFHPGWGYFARDLGLVQIAIEKEGKEPSAADLSEVIEQAKAARIKAIFVEPQFARTSAQVIANEIGAEIVIIDDLAYNWPLNIENTARLLKQSFD